MATPNQVSNLTPKIEISVEDYVLLKAMKDGSDKPDSKVEIPQAQPGSERSLLTRRHAMFRGARGMRAIVAPLSYYARQSGAANTAFAWNCALRPNLDSSWADWQGVFDEFRVLSAEIHWLVWFSTLPSGFATQTPNAAVAYDPTNQNLLTSVNSVMDYEKFQLLNVGANSNGTYATAPQSVAPRGYAVFRCKVPKGPQISVAETLNSSGLWRPCGDANNYDWGAFVGYTAAGGTSAVLQVETFVRMMVEFRVRR